MGHHLMFELHPVFPLVVALYLFLLPFNNGGILMEEINKIEEYRPAVIGFKGETVSSTDRYILHFYSKINDFYLFP